MSEEKQYKGKERFKGYNSGDKAVRESVDATYDGLDDNLKSFVDKLSEKFGEGEVVFTSGYRGEDDRSTHFHGNAVDMRPNPKVWNYLVNEEEGINLMVEHGLNMLDESDPKKLKGNAPHFHVSTGKYSNAVHSTDRYEKIGTDKFEVIKPFVEVYAEHTGTVYDYSQPVAYDPEKMKYVSDNVYKNNYSPTSAGTIGTTHYEGDGHDHGQEGAADNINETNERLLKELEILRKERESSEAEAELEAEEQEYLAAQQAELDRRNQMVQREQQMVSERGQARPIGQIAPQPQQTQPHPAQTFSGQILSPEFIYSLDNNLPPTPDFSDGGVKGNPDKNPFAEFEQPRTDLYQPKLSLYQQAMLQNVPVSDATKSTPNTQVIKQLDKEKERIEFKHETAKNIEKNNPRYSKEVTEKLAEDIARTNFDRDKFEHPVMTEYNQTDLQKERDKYVLEEGMNTREVLRYPLQFLAGATPTEEETFQERLRFTDPTTSRVDKLKGTVDQALDLAPSAALNTGIGLAFAPSRLGKFGQVVDAVSPVGYMDPKNIVKGVKQETIDWGKWNREIPKNKKLMAEYRDIEKRSKADGTWMKNPDGSEFKGTPEQFVQQNSENFKIAFPNPIVDNAGNIQINYHGQRDGKPFDVFKPSQRGGHGVGNYTFPGNREAALRYAKGDEKRLYELYINSNNPQKTVESVFSPEFNWTTGRLQPKHDYLRVGREQVTPEFNYLKSAIGNNGMFDMSNPNIYKSLVPTLIGTGAIGRQTIPSKEEAKKYKTGGAKKVRYRFK